MAHSDDAHRVLIDRADRLLRQSRALRKMSDELHRESSDVRGSANDLKPRKGAKRKKAR